MQGTSQALVEAGGVLCPPRNSRPTGRAPGGRDVKVRRRLGEMGDLELVDLVKERDGDAFEELMGRHRGLVTQICGALTANPHDTEDAVQATLLTVWRNIDKFEGRSKFSTWLHQVAYNTTCGEGRRRRPEPVGIAPDIDAEAGAIDRRVVDVDAVRRALAKLPEDYRSTLILRECLDLSIAEIAEIQIIAEGTVKSRLDRARKAIVFLLQERDL